jgi:hypothetical protein
MPSAEEGCPAASTKPAFATSNAGSTDALGATGCQMPTSGKSWGSRTSMSAPFSAGTYASAVLSSRFSRFSAFPPSQYCRLCTKLRASRAFSLGRYFSTAGSVRTCRPPQLSFRDSDRGTLSDLAQSRQGRALPSLPDHGLLSHALTHCRLAPKLEAFAMSEPSAEKLLIN